MKFDKKNKLLILFGTVLLLLVILAGLWAGHRVNTRLIPTGSVSISSTHSEYLIGEEITVKIQNDFNSTISFENNCPLEPLDVYRYQDTAWVRIHDKTDLDKCEEGEEEEGVPSNGYRLISFAAWPDLFNKAGRYRVVAYVDYYDQLPFTEFEVIKKPKVPEIPSVSNDTPLSSSSSNTINSSIPGGTLEPANSASSQTIKITQGTVVVTYDSSSIYVQSITPAAGYTYEGGRSGKEVEITFKGNDNEVKLELELVNGRIVQKIEQGDD